VTGRIRGAYEAINRAQQRHAVLGLPFAVVQKYVDDQGAYLAATIAYYGFLSVFPSLLVVTTIMGYVLCGHRHLSQTLVDSTFAQFPVVGPDLRVGTCTAAASRSPSASSGRSGPGAASSWPARTR